MELLEDQLLELELAILLSLELNLDLWLMYNFKLFWDLTLRNFKLVGFDSVLDLLVELDFKLY
jgi:hypothetical protein